MLPLDRSLRRQLENTVKEAREVAEAAARAAVDHLGVAEGKPPAFLSPTEKELRRRLRTHGRQLGDERHAKSETQETERLVEEVAYEHWHRMLFARFLAENDLLMYPDPDDPVAVTLAECEELAAEEGATNGWDLAARFAAKMLPQIFRPDSPVFELVLPPERQQELERLLVGLPKEVFQASDSLGWVYQFWQAKRKDEVNASEVKIGARELPAVTQLFTEPYMVAFLLDNTLGAWWAGQTLTADDFHNAKSEEELRQKAALPEMPLEYLRFVQDEGVWRPAAGTFPGWPKNLAELTVMDPCCGSGHFLVAALPMLASMRIAKDGLSARNAVDAVLRENLHGLEIDQRCVELAAFALALSAWRFPGSGGYRPLPTLEIACTGIAVGGTREQWTQILEEQGSSNLRFQFGQLYDLFRNAPTLGSLINPNRFLGSGMLDAKGRDALFQALAKAMVDEPDPASDRHALAVTAQGIARATDLLAGRYTLVVTNVPYLGRGKQADVLKEHLEQMYPLGKADLATGMVLRCLEFCMLGGSIGLVSPQNWLFLQTYCPLRETLLERREWNLVARLGPKAFQTPMWDFGVQLGVITANVPDKNQQLAGIDVSRFTRPDEKAAMLRGTLSADIALVSQHQQLNNPDAKISFSLHSGEALLSDLAGSYVGLQNNDTPKNVAQFWELQIHLGKWARFQMPSGLTALFAGRHGIVRWPPQPEYLVKGTEAWGRDGILIRHMGDLPATLYHGDRYDQSSAAIVPNDPQMLIAIWTFCSSPSFHQAVREIDQALKVTNATLVKIPFDLAYWSRIASINYPDGLPEPESDDPTQWLFHGRPEASESPLQVAVARLLGYRWPAELDEEMRLSERASALVERSEELLPLADKDGIVCILAVRGERGAADRLVDLLAKAYGPAWGPSKLNELLKSVGHEGKSLESWLRDKFFEQHCQLFHQRPFIWHIWDGLRDGFSVLVNYHKLDRKNLETLIYTYLGDWIARQKQDQAQGVDGAEERIAAAENLKRKLELILAGEAPYDIFIRWKPLTEQPIGWEPDLNDGVRLNIRPFMSVPDVKARGAGVLRVKPKIDWKKDRGKDVESAPWYSLGPQYGGKEGDRVNDHHLTLAEKRAAREAQKG